MNIDYRLNNGENHLIRFQCEDIYKTLGQEKNMQLMLSSTFLELIT